MRRLLLILLATTPLTGCQFLSAGEDVAIPDPFSGSDAGDVVADAGEQLIEAVTDSADFEEPTVEEAAQTVTISADLIDSTDPEARVGQVNQSRVDPFARLPIPNEIALAEIPVSAAGNSAAGAQASAGNRSAGAAASASASRPEPTRPPVSVQDDNPPLVMPTPIATLPSIPQPVVAPTISVSGIVQLGGEPYAIVTAQGEPERYVRVGDRLAGGSVRVKRIDTLAFEPQVILEENGIEVARPVGTTAAAGAGSASPVAAVNAPAAPAVPFPVAPIPTGSNTSLPPISQATPAAQPLPGQVPGSLLLAPPEAAQATLPNMQIGT